MLLFASCGRTPDITEYFPFEPDVYMAYKGEGNEFAEFETYVDYIENGAMQLRTVNPGTTTVSVYLFEDGALKKVFSEGEVYFRKDHIASRGAEDILIEEPVKVGHSWTAADGSKRSITALEAKVTVPYGEFKALEVTTDGEFSIIKDYYAAGVGLVKREFSPKEDPSQKVTSALEKLERGKAYLQSVRFYYPDPANERLVYMEKPLELHTGEDIAAAFAGQMKSIPENSGLTPLLSGNASILGIDFDRETGVVTADFSSEFITAMNAGASLEAMILSCVANTLGGYFQTDKVAVKIEGLPYESGHFRLSDGEYLTPSPEGVSEYLSNLNK